jgi:hypothetical protein
MVNMATRVTFEVGHDEVAIITMHNPPVNALAPAGTCFALPFDPVAMAAGLTNFAHLSIGFEWQIWCLSCTTFNVSEFGWPSYSELAFSYMQFCKG